MVLRDGLRRGNPGEPIAQLTTFGWILSGAMGGISSRVDYHAYHCATEDELTSLVRGFWEQEDLAPRRTWLTEEEEKCECQFVATHFRQSDGRYVVRLHTREPVPSFNSSQDAAISRLLGMERRFARDQALSDQYSAFLNEYAELGHMTSVSSRGGTSSRVAYLPHHGVWKICNGTPKLRVVFNGFAILRNGFTVNQYLSVGANLLPALTDTLTGWRLHRYVFVTDIEKMYRQILVHPLDRDLQRIVWRASPQDPVTHNQLNTVTYGLRCAPFLASRTLRQLAHDEGTRFPLGAKILLRGAYMDDLFAGAATLEEARLLILQLRGMCMAGGMPLKKWAANDPKLLQSIPTGDRQDGIRVWENYEAHSTLGVQWNPREDYFSFAVAVQADDRISKRGVLSQTARLFDPLGWLTPVIIRAKIFLQRLWLAGLDWDTLLPSEDEAIWRKFKGELSMLSEIKLPRWLGMGLEGEVHEIHGFADASERAYAAVVYLRTIKLNREVVVSLLASKTKVSPLKRVTLPRLELCAAQLTVRLVKHFCSIEGIGPSSIHCWSDSTMALSWIRGHLSQWQTYVANRVACIQNTVPEVIWHHIPGIENPADCASRGLLPSDLVNHQLWWRGPEWLSKSEQQWPQTIFQPSNDLPEARPIVMVAVARKEPEELLRFSTLRRLLRTTAWLMRWVRGHRAGLPPAANPGGLRPLTVTELELVRRFWLLQVQAGAYAEELGTLRRGQDLGRRSSRYRFGPFIDAEGLLRVGGRLRHSILSAD